MVVNFVASIPGGVARVPCRDAQLARAGDDAHRARRLHPGWTSGLSRFGVTWSFFIGELLGVVLIFLGFLVSIEVFSDVRLPFTHIVLRRREHRTAVGRVAQEAPSR